MFGPTLLKTTEGSASLSSLVDTVHQTRVVELLTKHANTIFGSNESSENDPIPEFLRPEYTHKAGKSPRMMRPSSPPKINLVSLKDFSGLEGVRTSQLSTQDSVDHGGHGAKSRAAGPLPSSASESSEQAPETPGDNGQVEPALASSIVSISQENRVKIQVPGPGQPHGKTSKSGGGSDHH